MFSKIRKDFRLLVPKRMLALFSITIALVLLLPMASSAKKDVLEFENPSLIVVYSETDEDAQIIARGGSEDPIDKLVILGPHGTVHFKSRFKDGGRIGQADFQFDTPEPSLEELMDAYPPGEYRFLGKTVDDGALESIVELSYDLLDSPTIIYPENGDRDIPTENLVVEFAAPEDSEAIRLEIEDEEEEVAIKVDLPGNTDSFSVTNGWLQPGIEYVLDIKAFAENGNQTVVDIRFVTTEESPEKEDFFDNTMLEGPIVRHFKRLFVSLYSSHASRTKLA